MLSHTIGIFLVRLFANNTQILLEQNVYENVIENFGKKLCMPKKQRTSFTWYSFSLLTTTFNNNNTRAVFFQHPIGYKNDSNVYSKINILLKVTYILMEAFIITLSPVNWDGYWSLSPVHKLCLQSHFFNYGKSWTLGDSKSALYAGWSKMFYRNPSSSRFITPALWVRALSCMSTTPKVSIPLLFCFE